MAASRLRRCLEVILGRGEFNAQQRGHFAHRCLVAEPAVQHAKVVSLALAMIFAQQRFDRLLDQILDPGGVKRVDLLDRSIQCQ